MKITNILMVTPQAYSYGGLLIAGIIELAGYNVVVTKNLPRILELAYDADIVCLSLQSTSHLFKLKNILQLLKQRMPRKIIIAGGPAVQDVPFASKLLPMIDIFVLGEGDEIIVQVIKHINNLKSIENGNLISFNNSVIVASKTLPQLSGRPFPKIPADLKDQNIRGVNIYIETHRGCIGRCAFCQYCKLFGNKIRSRPLTEILNEIRYLQMYGIKKIAFSAGDMTLYGTDLKDGNAQNFASLYKKASRILGRENLAGPDVRPDRITAEILKTVKNFTHGWVFLGIESGSQKILDLMRKGIKLEDIYEAVKLARKYKVKILGSFIVGSVMEENSDFSETKQLIKELRLDKCSINICEPIPTTPYWEVVRDFPLDENPLFLSAEKEQFKGLSVAEERAIILHQICYEVKHGEKMPRSILRKRISKVRREAQRIKKIILKMKELTFAS